MKRFLKIFFIIVFALLVLVQFYPRPKKNISSGIDPADITKVHNIPLDVQQILTSSCYDCHSNNTAYPWYSNIQPVSMWLGDHIDEGRSELNFSEFGNYALRRQFRKLEEIGEEVSEGEMPLKSYTLIHSASKLNEQQRSTLVNWTKALRDSFSNNYPADSLIKKK